jgi:hypothetical protein
VLNTATLRFSELICTTPQKSMFEDGLTSHASAVISISGSSEATHFIIYGGQSRDYDGRLSMLDLRTMQWKWVPIAQPARPRKKHTLTAVPGTRRLYAFGGRDAHSVFGDLVYFEYSQDLTQWTTVNVTEQMQLSGRTNLSNPNVRFEHTCTYSHAAGGLVLFGGNGTAGMRNDVWLLDTTTNLWVCKHNNDPSMLGQTAAQHAQLAAQQSGETKPLPRMSHSACLLHVNGVEHLAIYGGYTMFLVGEQMIHSDLWLLNTTTWRWTKIHPVGLPPALPPIDLDQEDEEAVLAEMLRREESEHPTRRWCHGCFVQKETTAAAAATTAAASFSNEEQKSVGPSSSSSGNTADSTSGKANSGMVASGKFVVFGGACRNAVGWMDVFDFSTMRWTREFAHPATTQVHPLINITEDGCLWINMQTRFRKTQPEAFSQPIVEEASASAAHSAISASVALPVPSSLAHSLVTSPFITATCSLDECIAFNLRHEQSIFSHPTPLPLASFVHFLVEGRVLTCPKIILVSRCPTFLSQLTSNIRDANLAQKNLIVLEGVRYIIFRCILYWMYSGDEELIVTVKSSLVHAPHPMDVDTISASLSLQPPSHPLASASSSPVSSSGGSSSRGTKRPPAGGVESDSESDLSLGTLDLERSTSEGLAKKQKGVNGEQVGRPSLEAIKPVMIHSAVVRSLDADHDVDMPDAAAASFIAAALPAAAAPFAVTQPATTAQSGDDAHALSTYIADPLEILTVADRFNLTSLCSVLEIGLSRQIDVTVVCKFLYFADIYHLAMLTQRCIIFIIQHYEEITTSVEYGSTRWFACLMNRC